MAGCMPPSVMMLRSLGWVAFAGGIEREAALCAVCVRRKGGALTHSPFATPSPAAHLTPHTAPLPAPCLRAPQASTHRSRLARRPFGGSVVILMLRCRMAMGKAGDGDDDSQRRKRSWGRCCSKPSISLSSAGSQLVMRWQLARNTQWPCRRPSSMSRCATSACPWPSATAEGLRCVVGVEGGEVWRGSCESTCGSMR